MDLFLLLFFFVCCVMLCGELKKLNFHFTVVCTWLWRKSFVLIVEEEEEEEERVLMWKGCERGWTRWKEERQEEDE